MKKNYVQHVIIHASKSPDNHTLSQKINEFHVEVIKRRLHNAKLTTDKKLEVIDCILENLKSREKNGVIK